MVLQGSDFDGGRSLGGQAATHLPRSDHLSQSHLTRLEFHGSKDAMVARAVTIGAHHVSTECQVSTMSFSEPKTRRGVLPGLHSNPLSRAV